MKFINTLLLLIITVILIAISFKISNKDKNVLKCNIPNQTAQKISKGKAPYPEEAIRIGEEGTTTVRVQINQIGEPKSVQIIESSGYSSLDKSALNFIQNSIFMPTIKDCAIIETQIKMKIRFSLDN